MRRLSALLIFLMAPAGAAAAPGDAADPEANARAAVRLLESAADAMGGAAAVREARTFLLETQGDLFWLDQGPTPATPMRFGFGHRQFADFGDGLTYLALDYAGPESSFQRSTVLRHDSGSDSLLELAALSPVTIVRHLLSRPADLRLARGGTAVAGPVMGRLVELEVGPDALPRAVTYLIVDDLVGDAPRRFDYSEYRQENGWTVPARIRQIDADRLAHETALTAFAVDPGRPEWSAGLEPRQAHPPGEAGGLVAERIAPRAHFLKRHGGADYHGLAVELDEGWMVLETPGAIGDGAELRTVLSAIAAKPIVYVAATHHHGDHSAGMPAVAKDGATVLTTPGNVDYFRRMTEASRGFDGGRTTRVRALADGERIGPVRFLDAGPTAHVEEILLFHLPEHRILFHSDMGRFNDDGSVEPARPQTCRLLAFIEQRELAVDTIYSGHGRPGTMEDLRQSVAMPGSACSDAGT